MNPLFFGNAESPLYGVYLPPKATPRDAGIVLCYPFGQEYMRAHRAFRQLAMLLSKKGYHVLRFDYRGIGDSSDDIENVSPQQWSDDVGAAIQELRTTAAVSSVSVLGLRLGALIAGTACVHRDDVDRLILWDPILNGADYEQELLAEIAKEKPSPWGGPGSGNLKMADGGIYYNGFPLTRRFCDGLRSLDLVSNVPTGNKQVLLAVSHETAEFTRLKVAWQSHAGFQYQHTPAPHDWNYVDHYGGILLPQPVIQSIVSWME